ncbi:hypothetical protein Tco_0617150 [Tanacetum coccineum]
MGSHRKFRNQGQKEWDNPPNIISEQEVANLKAQAKRLFGNKNIWVEMHRGIAWDKVENPNPQSTPHVLLSFEEYTPPVTYPKELEETLGTPVEVEPLDETQLEDLGLNTCNHDIPLSSLGESCTNNECEARVWFSYIVDVTIITNTDLKHGLILVPLII